MYDGGILADNDPDHHEKIVQLNELPANCAIYFTTLDLTATANELSREGWSIDRTTWPPSTPTSPPRFADSATESSTSTRPPRHATGTSCSLQPDRSTGHNPCTPQWVPLAQCRSAAPLYELDVVLARYIGQLGKMTVFDDDTRRTYTFRARGYLAWLAAADVGGHALRDPAADAWTTHWKASLNAFQIAFEGRLTPASHRPVPQWPRSVVNLALPPLRSWRSPISPSPPMLRVRCPSRLGSTDRYPGIGGSFTLGNNRHNSLSG